MRRAVVSFAALAVCLGSAGGAASSASHGDPCRGFTDAGRESHRLIFNVRCQFEIRRIVVEPSSPVWGVGRSTELHGDVEEGDRIRCKQGPGRESARCRGNAGSGVRVTGRLETKDIAFDCEMTTRMKVFGEPDREPDGARGNATRTDEIAPRPPRNCHNIPDFRPQLSFTGRFSDL